MTISIPIFKQIKMTLKKEEHMYNQIYKTEFRKNLNEEKREEYVDLISKMGKDKCVKLQLICIVRLSLTLYNK